MMIILDLNPNFTLYRLCNLGQVTELLEVLVS